MPDQALVMDPQAMSLLLTNMPGILQFLQARREELAAENLEDVIPQLTSLQTSLSASLHPDRSPDQLYPSPAPSPLKRRQNTPASSSTSGLSSTENLMDNFLGAYQSPRKKAQLCSNPSLSDSTVFAHSPPEEIPQTRASSPLSELSNSEESTNPVEVSDFEDDEPSNVPEKAAKSSKRKKSKRKCRKPQTKAAAHKRGVLQKSRIRQLLRDRGLDISEHGDVDEPPLPSLNAKHMLLDIMSFATSSEALTRVQTLLDDLLDEGTYIKELRLPGIDWKDCTLFGLAQRYQKMEQQKNVAHYAYLITVVQIRIQIHRHVENARKLHLTNEEAGCRHRDLAHEMGLTLYQFGHLLQRGSKLVYLCGAGSPYLLVLLASIGCNKYIDTTTCKEEIEAVAMELCCYRPVQDPCFFLIHQFLVQMCCDIRQRIGDKMNSFFQLDFGDEVLSFQETLDITHRLREVNVNWFAFPPVSEAWNCLFEESVDPDRPPFCLPRNVPQAVPKSMLDAETISIQLADFIIPDLNKDLRKLGDKWTEEQRTLALQATELNFAPQIQGEQEDIQDWLMNSFDNGIQNDPCYGLFETSNLRGRRLHIKDSNGNMVLHIATGLGQEHKHLNTAIQHTIMALEPEFRSIEPNKEIEAFPAVHLMTFNRYTMKGHDEPTDVHPSFQKTIGNNNTTQRFPHNSEFRRSNPEGAHRRDVALEIIHKAVQFVIQSGLASEDDELRISVESLPFNDYSPAYPLAGYVININVSSGGHADRGDRKLCVIVPFGEFEGGELVLYELGLVLRLSPLDIVIFPSDRIIHFNLKHSGIRGSVVMATDREIDCWVKDKNGWQDKNFPGDVFHWEDVMMR
ncbi:hypothetical protein C8J56DRAFT_1058984 [Mycena floridula]|nr:hypothetical protein C8J56DRAFT_1058984 [Mycena floridula]